MFAFSWLGSALASCAATCACHACGFASREVMRRSARLAYCVLFTLAMILAWVLRDFAKPLIDKIPWIIRHAGVDPSDRWYGQQAVYRVSLGNFMFFGLLALTMVGVKYKSDKRDRYLQHGGWFVKIGLWLLFNALPFFFPIGLVNAYGYLARVGSGLFLCVQILMLLDFITSWNDAWVDKEDNRYLWGLLGITGACYLGTIGLTAVLFYFFKPSSGGDCSFNVTMIIVTLLVGLLMSMLSISTLAQNGSLFPAAVLTLYCTYLCYSALTSEPHDDPCNGLGHKLNAASASTLAIGMGLALLAVVYSALRAGSNTHLFGFGSEDGDGPADQPLMEEGASAGPEEEHKSSTGRGGERALDEEFAPVTYNYSFFHIIFALASMYIAMLMTGWGTGAEEKDLIDVGWFSVTVKFTTLFLTATTYCWMLVAPSMFPDREFY